MKIIIAISGCDLYERNGVNQSQRDTWLRDAVILGMDYKFFHGIGCEPKDDVVLLDCDDSIHGVTEKLKGKVRWALEQGYEYMFSCFADTYARPERLLASGFDKFDYFGDVGKGECEHATYYCHGGAGYFLSRKAMIKIKDNPTSYTNDDCWVGDVLSGTDTTCGNSEDFRQYVGTVRKDNNITTSHMSDSSHHPGVHPFTYTPDYMYNEHRAFMESKGEDKYTPTYQEIVGRRVSPVQAAYHTEPIPEPPARAVVVASPLSARNLRQPFRR